MSKVLVTGGCGYIGSHTVVELLENNYEVISIDNFCNSDRSVLDSIYDITSKRVTNYEIDLRDVDNLRKVFQDNEIEFVIHFAAFKSVPESVSNPISYYDNNINGLINLLKFCNEFNVKKFIFSSSCSIYGTPKNIPVFENSKISPESPYARTKYFCEEIIKDFSKNSKIKFISLRYFNPIGAHDSLKIGEISTSINVLSRIVATHNKKQEKLLVYGNDWPTQDGTCVRDYIHVSDVAEVHRISIDKNIFDSFKAINIGTGKGHSVLELIKIFEEISNEKLNYEVVSRRPGDVSEIWADVSNSLQILNWSPKRDIYDSVRSHLMFSLKSKNC